LGCSTVIQCGLQTACAMISVQSETNRPGCSVPSQHGLAPFCRTNCLFNAGSIDPERTDGGMCGHLHRGAQALRLSNFPALHRTGGHSGQVLANVYGSVCASGGEYDVSVKANSLAIGTK
jgi:hypothetical protein